jgi:hypothetical protein
VAWRYRRARPRPLIDIIGHALSEEKRGLTAAA